MPAIIPQLSNTERDDRLAILRRNPVYPISTQWSQVVNATNLATADVSGLGSYDTNVLNLPYAYAIVGLRLSNVLIADGTVIPYFAVAVSYLSSFTVAAYGGTATQPDEAGNVIYRMAQVDTVLNDYVPIKNGPDPDNFFVPANTPIYIHQWASTALVTDGSATAQGFLTLYLMHTGIRT